MAKDEKQIEETIEPRKVIYILGYKDGRRLFHAEYFSKVHVLDRCAVLMARQIEFRIAYREMDEVEEAHYETL